MSWITRNDQRRSDSDDISLGSAFDHNPEVAAATAWNDDGDWLVNKKTDTEEV